MNGLVDCLKVLRGLAVLCLGLVATMLSGCLVVGYSSNGGWFLWPGGFSVLVLVLLIVMLRRRR